MKLYPIFLGILLTCSPLLSYSQCDSTLVENFDSRPSCSGNCNSPCTFSVGSFWTNSTNDNTDWTIDANGTSSSQTGPSGDHTTGTGKYIYTESGSPCANRTAILISQPIDLNGFTSYSLEFWYHLYGATMGDLFVEVSNDSQNTWIQIDSINDNQNLWQFRSLSLNNYLNDTVTLRFRGVIGSSFTSDMALDDITVKGGLPSSIMPTISVTSPVACNGDSNAVLTASGAPSNAPYNFLWNTNDTTAIVSGLAAGTYSVILTDSNGCTDSASIVLTQPPSNILTITQSGDTLTADQDSATSYQWIDCNNNNAPISGANSQSFVVPSSGDFAVIIDVNGCIDTTSCVNVILVGLDQNLSDDQISIFPNPTKDQLNLLKKGEGFNNERLRIFDTNGKLIIERRISGSNVHINVSEVPAGIYFIQLEGNRQKLIIAD